MNVASVIMYKPLTKFENIQRTYAILSDTLVVSLSKSAPLFTARKCISRKWLYY